MSVRRFLSVNSIAKFSNFLKHPAASAVYRAELSAEPVMASAQTLPDFRCASSDACESEIIRTCPPAGSVMAGAAPLYGTCSALTPATGLNSSAAGCTGVPLPAETHERVRHNIQYHSTQHQACPHQGDAP